MITLTILCTFVLFVIYMEWEVSKYNKNHKKNIINIKKMKLEYNSSIHSAKINSDQFLQYIQEVNKDLKKLQQEGG